jgi:class 3 adenylate cyclase
VDLDAATEAGLYDPAAPDAADRRALLEFLDEQGCGLDEMVAAHAQGRLFGLAGDRVIRPGRNELTLRHVAAGAGADLDLVQRLWRAFGFPITDADTPVASRADADVVPLFVAIAAALGADAALGLARVAGASVARFADAVSAALRGALPELSIESSASELTTAQAYLGVATFAPPAGRALDVLLRHHLDAARRQFELSDSYDVAGSGQVRLAVGFADLSGFTALSQTATSGELSLLLKRFEDVATSAVQQRGGRVVKFIGDEVMYVTPLAADAVAVARAVVDGLGENAARAGVSYGVLLAQDGDYFGPPVNLAARLVGAAEPGQVLVSEALRERLDGTYGTTPLPPRELRGIAEPVTPYVVG